MKISGFTIIRNGSLFDYPYRESLRSLLPCVDELVVNVGSGDDNTLENIEKLAQAEKKIKYFERDWELDNREKKKNGVVLSEQTNFALSQCSGDWCIYLQADEVLHEQDFFQLRACLEKLQNEPQVEGLLLDYLHFYGSYKIIQVSRSSYRREVRIFRNHKGIKSIGDAQSFRNQDGTKLKVILSGVRVFHYGWVREPSLMKKKTYHFDQLYHGEPDAKARESEQPFTGDNYRYKRILGLKKYTGSHPQVMHGKIESTKWSWDFETTPMEWKWSDLKKITLDCIERVTGVRFFEYKSYRLVAKPTLFVHAQKVSLIVSTYEQPRHLELVCAGILRQSYKNLEVLFCDDGSGSSTLKVIEDFKALAPFPVQHFWQPHEGFRKCKILNQAIREAQGETLIFLDGDSIPHKHYVLDHAQNQEAGTYLAGRRLELGPTLSHSMTPKKIRNGFFDFPKPALLKSILKGETTHLQRSLRVPFPIFRKILKMNHIIDMKGGNFSVSKKVMDAINGFDETYEGYGREDTDVEIRFQNLGLKIKSLKGLALQFHVWHEKREFTLSNDVRLEELKQSKKTRCERGLL